MGVLEAIILGIVQGATEFLPVSSSGHLVLAQHLLGFKDLHNYLLFNLVLHLGTLLAIFIVFFKPLLHAFTEKKRIMQVILATLPLFPLLFLLKPIEDMFDRPELLGYFFILTALLLYIGLRQSPRAQITETAAPYRDAFIIGLFQALAILPGISRSGATISGAFIIGWGSQAAVFFSFLIAIPAILGSAVLEGLHILKEPSAFQGIPVSIYLWGFIAAFLTGLAALLLLIRLAAKNKLQYFIWYCLAVGIFALLYTNFPNLFA